MSAFVSQTDQTNQGACQAHRLHASCVHMPARGGVLITGPSGAGKSTLALMLIERFGAALVADDQTVVNGGDDGTLLASCPPTIKGQLEVRGVGIVPYNQTVAETSVAMVVALTACDTESTARLPAPLWEEISGIQLPLYRLGPLGFCTADRVMAAYRLTLHHKTTQAVQG
ncbi:MAG: HPr kinase/phosphatase C-terminal domain-containing protein [Pseudomonadota bacterium]